MDFSRGLICALVAGFAAAAYPSVLIEMEAPVAARAAVSLPERNIESADMAADRRAMETVQRKLQETIFPEVDFHDVTVREALAFLNRGTGVPMVMRDLILPEDPPSPEHPEKGAPIIPGLSQEQSASPAISPSEARITLTLKSVSAAEVLRYVVTLAGLTHRIEPGVVVIVPLMTGMQTLQSRDFSIPLADRSPVQIQAFEKQVRKILEDNGVSFPPGSSLRYDASKECLTIGNGETNLDRIEDILGDLSLQSLSEEDQKIEIQKRAARVPREVRKIQKWRLTMEQTMARKVEIQDASMAEVLRELRGKILCGAEATVDLSVRLNLSMRNVPVTELLRQIAEQTKTQAVIGSGIVVFVPPLASSSPNP